MRCVSVCVCFASSSSLGELMDRSSPVYSNGGQAQAWTLGGLRGCADI